MSRVVLLNDRLSGAAGRGMSRARRKAKRTAVTAAEMYISSITQYYM